MEVDKCVVNLVPGDVNDDNFEEILGTSRLFRDFFNKFLLQEPFDERASFNANSLTFETSTSERAAAITSIREAVFRNRRVSPVKQLTLGSAYRRIPLVPMELETKNLPSVQTQFAMHVLSRTEVGLWMKQNRLPLFMSSVLYHKYRLASLLSQAAILRASVGKVPVIYDRELPKESSRDRRKIKKSPFDRKISELEVGGTVVSYGNADCESIREWYDNAQSNDMNGVMANENGTDHSTARPRSGRPRDESGYGSSTKMSSCVSRVSSARVRSRADGTASPSSSFVDEIEIGSAGESGADEFPFQTLQCDLRLSIIPCPADISCVAELEQIKHSGQDASIERSQNCDSAIENIGTKTVCPEAKKHYIEENDQEIFQACVAKLGNPDLTSSLLDSIQRDFPENSPGKKKQLASATLTRLLDNEHFVRIVSKMSPTQIATTNFRSLVERVDIMAEEADEVESISGEILQNDQNEQKMFVSILSFAALERFEEFLRPTPGWAAYNLWLDIDKLVSKIQCEVKGDYSSSQLSPAIYQMLTTMRKSYVNVGGDCALSSSEKQRLQLDDPDNWTPGYLNSIQTDLAERLVNYWALRFLHHEQSHGEKRLQKSEKYVAHSSQRVGPTPANPIMQAPCVLPQRPKTCNPKPKIVPNPPRPNRFNSQFVSAPLPPMPIEMPFRRTHLISRPVTAPSAIQNEASHSLDNADSSDLFGSERLEHLFQVLRSEALTGQFFERFIRQTQNRLWLDSLLFWMELQEYHALFSKPIYNLTVKAGSLAGKLYATYIMPGCRDSAGIAETIARRILKKMNIPFEELFDEAEEAAILSLFNAYNSLSQFNCEKFNNVSKETVQRTVQTRHPQILKVCSKSDMSVLPLDDMDDLDVATEAGLPQLATTADRRLWETVPEEFRDWTLEKIVFNRTEFEFFRQFLEDNMATTDLYSWMDIESFRRLPPTNEKLLDKKAGDIKEKYLSRKYFFGIHSPATKPEQVALLEQHGGWTKMLETLPPLAMLVDVQGYVARRLDVKWLPTFLATTEFFERQRPKPPDTSAEEDRLAQKRRKAAQIAKMLEGQWSTSAQEILLFRQALSNKKMVELFSRFLKLRNVAGAFLSNDLQFYCEVQRFKELCHAHQDDALVMHKINQIITRFLDVQYAQPALQIDVPSDIAEKIIYRRKELGPYLFREAQQTVFQALMSQWLAFCKLRESVTLTPPPKLSSVERLHLGLWKHSNTTPDGLLELGKSAIPARRRKGISFIDILERHKAIIDAQIARLEEAEANVKTAIEENASSASEAGADEAVSAAYNPFADPAEHAAIARKATKISFRYSNYSAVMGSGPDQAEDADSEDTAKAYVLSEAEFDAAVELFPHLFDESIVGILAQQIAPPSRLTTARKTVDGDQAQNNDEKGDFVGEQQRIPPAFDAKQTR